MFCAIMATMGSNLYPAPQARAPTMTKRKVLPLVHGIYANSPKALRVRALKVTRLVRQLYEFLPHLRDEHLPLVRKWAELEVIRRAAFAGIVQGGSILSVDLKTRDVSVKRLIDDHRKLAMAQLIYERELLMTPAARAQLRDGEQPTDLVAMMAATEPETAEVVEPEPEGPESDS
jgi:hypothetical protein